MNKTSIYIGTVEFIPAIHDQIIKSKVNLLEVINKHTIDIEASRNAGAEINAPKATNIIIRSTLVYEGEDLLSEDFLKVKTKAHYHAIVECSDAISSYSSNKMKRDFDIIINNYINDL